MPPATPLTPAPATHSWYDDTHALIAGSLFVALGMTMLATPGCSPAVWRAWPFLPATPPEPTWAPSTSSRNGCSRPKTWRGQGADGRGPGDRASHTHGRAARARGAICGGHRCYRRPPRAQPPAWATSHP